MLRSIVHALNGAAEKLIQNALGRCSAWIRLSIPGGKTFIDPREQIRSNLSLLRFIKDLMV